MTHGMWKHPAYRSWGAMLQRCLNPRYSGYYRYGGRGITICSRWRESFISFWADMGTTWRKGLQLDRRDNDGAYSPDNCRWATRKEQANNRTMTHKHFYRQS